MTPADLRAITMSLNDERGSGGQSKLARLLDWHHSTVWRKLNGASPITQADELAIRQALVLESRQKACPARTLVRFVVKLRSTRFHGYRWSFRYG
jgi:hypothetical protein